MDNKNMITVREAAKFLGLSVHTLNNKRCNQTGPKYFKLGRAVRYRYKDLEDWINQNQIKIEVREC